MAGISDLLGGVGDYLGELDTGIGDIIAGPQREDKLLQNLQAQGYMGQDVSGGAVESRGPIGGLLQALHIIGAPTMARPLSPYEQMAYMQGKVGAAEQGMGLEAKGLNIKGLKQQQQLARLSAMGALAKEGQMPPASDFPDMTPDEAAALRGIVGAYQNKTDLDKRQIEEHIKYMQSQENAAANKGQPTVDIFSELGAIGKIPANKVLVDKIMELYHGKDLPTGHMGGLLDPETPQAQKQGMLDQARLLLKRLEINLRQQGNGPAARNIALALTTGQEPNQFTDVMGLDEDSPVSAIMQQVHNQLNPPSVSRAVGMFPGLMGEGAAAYGAGLSSGQMPLR